jgi:phospholipid/cholesterol/gamma-HCH transport system substrate-binding protein
MNPVNPEMLAAYPKRLPSNRSNAYTEPGAYDQLAKGLPVFGNFLCQNTGPATSLAPPAQNPLLTADLRKLIEEYVYTPAGPVAPPCRQQANLGRLVGQPTKKFPQLKPIPAP